MHEQKWASEAFPSKLPKYKVHFSFSFPHWKIYKHYISLEMCCADFGEEQCEKKSKTFFLTLFGCIFFSSFFFCVLLECYNLSPGIWNSHKDILLCGYLKISVSILGMSFSAIFAGITSGWNALSL